MQVVDPSNPIPKYLQISGWLKELIRNERYRVGEQLPSEPALADICDVNRNTVRQAIGELVSQGLLRKEKGRGTFVISRAGPAVKHRLKRISSFADDLREAGVVAKTVVLRKGVEAPSDSVARSLVLGPGQKVGVIHRLRTGNGIPLIYEKSYLPHPMFDGILKMDLTESMYRIMTKKFNTSLSRCEQSIRAVNLEGAIAETLSQPENSAGLFMESLTFNEHNIPVELLYSYYRGDKYVCEVEQGRYQIKNKGAEL